MRDIREWAKTHNFDLDRINMRSEHGNTALMRAAIEGDLEVAKTLLQMLSLIHI